MAIGAPLIASLKAIGTVMNDAYDPWWIIASAAVALHGADAGHISDVDVLLSVDDAMRILPALGVKPQKKEGHPIFRSRIFATWNDAPLPVEFMAGFCYRSGDDWLQVQPITRQTVKVDGVTVFIPARTELRRLLEGFGRPKDLLRVRQLAVVEHGPA